MGDGTGNFQEAPRVPVSKENLPVYLAAADLDEDGNLDLIVAHCCGQTNTTYLLGNGDGTFQAEQQLPSGAASMAVAVNQSGGYTTVVSAGNVGAGAIVLGFALLLSIATGVLFGLVPSLSALR